MKYFFNLCIALARVRFIILIDKYLMDGIVFCKGRKNIRWLSIINFQCTVVTRQFFYQDAQCTVDKFNPCIFLVFKPVKDITVENKNRQNRQVRFQRMIETRVVVQSQVAPEPEDIDSGLHSFVPFNNRTSIPVSSRE